MLPFLFEQGSGIPSFRGVEYGVYKNGSWTYQKVEGYSDPYGWKNMYSPSIAVDTAGHAHIVYVYNDSNDPRKYEIHYATNQSGSWVFKTIAFATGTSGIDEVKEPRIEVDNYNNIHITYVKEDNQNSYYGNYYYTHKNVNDPEFPAAEKIVDAVADQKNYRYTPFVVDPFGKISFSFYEGNNTQPYTTYFQTNQMGSWQRDVVYTDTSNITYPVRVSNINSKSTILMYTQTKNVHTSTNRFFCDGKNGGTWTTRGKYSYS